MPRSLPDQQAAPLHLRRSSRCSTLTVGQIETITLTPICSSSRTMRRRVGPGHGIELPVAHLRPVEEVDDDDGERQAAALVLAGHRQQLVLRVIAQLALPEAGCPLGQQWSVAGGVNVVPQDAGERVRRR